MIKCMFENGGIGFLRHITVDVLILKDQKILLVKRSKKLIEGGKWAAPGGFVDRDETIFQAAKREALEETGWKVGNLTLLRIKDNPDRRGEDRQNIAFTFFGVAIAQNGKTDWESEEIRWFDLNSLPRVSEIAFDHKDDIDIYKKYLKEKFDIPLPLK